MKTAVEWLYNKMFENQGRILREDYEQAKEMEKQQIIDAYDNGNYDNGMGRCEAEQYYNETFKSK